MKNKRVVIWIALWCLIFTFIIITLVLFNDTKVAAIIVSYRQYFLIFIIVLFLFYISQMVTMVKKGKFRK